MTIREFLELCSTSEEVYLYDLDNGTESCVEVDNMDDIEENILDSEIQSWDYRMRFDGNGYEKSGTRLCINYCLED